jgi:hypothetical protein
LEGAKGVFLRRTLEASILLRWSTVLVPVLALWTAASCSQSPSPPANVVDRDADAQSPQSEPGFVVCDPGQRTTVSGVVYDPAGKNPLYGVLVYTPQKPVDPIPQGLVCEKCGIRPSGDPSSIALTDAGGRFVLDDVPAGENVPLVMQIGRWRRTVTIPRVRSCRDTAMLDPEVMRLPRTSAEGDIPLMAIATGEADPFECLLKKIGIAPSELTPPSGTGRVHVYVAQGGANTVPPAPPAVQLWSNAELMKKYDVVLLPCERDEFTNTKPLSSRQALVDYANAGGRVFTTHYGYTWLADKCDPGECGGTEFAATGVWDVNQYNVPSPLPATIDTTFPKGAAFADWLQATGATETRGTILLEDARHDLNDVNPPAQRWMTAKDDTGRTIVQHMTFNTPLSAPEDKQCGRVVFSDFHVAASQRIGSTIPIHCKNDPMSPQEKALEYMLFDLSSCIQKDDRPVEPPR